MSFDRLLAGNVPQTNQVIATSPMDNLLVPQVEQQRLGGCPSCPPVRRLGEVTPMGIPAPAIAVGLIAAFFLFGGTKLLKK